MIALLNISAVLFVLQEPPKLSLDEALRIAHEKAFSLKIAESNIEKARQKVNEAKGALGPKLVLDASYTRFDKAQTTEFGGNTITTRPVDSKDAKLTFNIGASVTTRALGARQPPGSSSAAGCSRLTIKPACTAMMASPAKAGAGRIPKRSKKFAIRCDRLGWSARMRFITRSRPMVAGTCGRLCSYPKRTQ